MTEKSLDRKACSGASPATRKPMPADVHQPKYERGQARENRTRNSTSGDQQKEPPGRGVSITAHSVLLSCTLPSATHKHTVTQQSKLPSHPPCCLCLLLYEQESKQILLSLSETSPNVKRPAKKNRKFFLRKKLHEPPAKPFLAQSGGQCQGRRIRFLVANSRAPIKRGRSGGEVTWLRISEAEC
jgi:hypothetical protein